ncbi:MAG: DUF1826 domain-containing protein [Cellvibrio sp.]|nr:DUF1826 domain-containing protein [Cellvibrio sp.]
MTTYYGLATEWLPDQLANRAALGTAFASQSNTLGAITANAAIHKQGFTAPPKDHIPSLIA